MTYQPAEPDPAAWDQFVEASGGHILQTTEWGALKRAFGWSDCIVTVESGGETAAGALMLFRRLPLGIGSIAYVPRGPVLDWSDEAACHALFEMVNGIARRQGAVLLKIEPDTPNSAAMRDTLARLGFSESSQTVQPPNTILIDISGPRGDVESSDDAALMAMSGSTRRKIRIAYRKGIEVRRGSAADVESFNHLVQVTGHRNEFGVHSPAYYHKAYDLFAPDHAALLMASYEGTDVAGLFAFACGDTAWYFYGASSDQHRDKMPTYALQWEAIRWAREQGCTTYDMWGIPDADEVTLEAGFQDRDDGLWGVYGFKRGFGGEVVRTVGAWDRPYRPLLYRAYDLAIRVRARDIDS